MATEFDYDIEAEVAATPDQIWQAIATGPGIDSWFMGHNDVQPGPDGQWRMTGFGEYTPSHTVTAWEESTRLAYRTGDDQDGRFVAYEFLIEGRAGGSTTLQLATSGFLPGDDWEDEYEAMRKGLDLFFATLTSYLTRFAGRTASPVTAFGPMITDWADANTRLHAALGLTTSARPGDAARLTAPEPIEGEVYFAGPDAIGIRTEDAMYRFMKGFGGPAIASHHIFREIDEHQTTRAWQTWLERVLTHDTKDIS